MGMKKLGQFTDFDFEAFAAGKSFQVTGIKQWLDFEGKNKPPLGTAVEVAIVEDNTVYFGKGDEVDNTVTNLFEKFSIKIADVAPAMLGIKVGDIVEPIGATASVYGDFRDKLSVKAENIRVVDQ